MSPHRRFLLVLVASAALGACRSTAPVESRPAPAPEVRGPVYRYVASVQGLPAGCQVVRLSARLPGASEAGSIADLRARLLIGNALLEIAPECLASPPAEDAATAPTWSWKVSRSDASTHLDVESDGRPIEVELRFVADGSVDAATLAAGLSGDTHAEVDGRAWTRVDTRLARVR
jgi:hypothetical protein